MIKVLGLNYKLSFCAKITGLHTVSVNLKCTWTKSCTNSINVFMQNTPVYTHTPVYSTQAFCA